MARPWYLFVCTRCGDVRDRAGNARKCLDEKCRGALEKLGPATGRPGFRIYLRAGTLERLIQAARRKPTP